MYWINLYKVTDEETQVQAQESIQLQQQWMRIQVLHSKRNDLKDKQS
jgi:hypothetical protein